MRLSVSSHSSSYSDDFDADGIADTRTVRTWTYDPVGKRCTETTEIDFDADGAIDSRSTAMTTGIDGLSC